MTETRSTSTTRVKAHRARKSRGVHLVLVELSEAQVDRLAHESYLDGNNTLEQAIEAFWLTTCPPKLDRSVRPQNRISLLEYPLWFISRRGFSMSALPPKAAATLVGGGGS